MKKFVIFSLLCINIVFVGCASVSSKNSDNYNNIIDYRERVMQTSSDESLHFDTLWIADSLTNYINFKKVVMGESDIDLAIHVTKESFSLNFHIKNKD